MQIIWNGQNRTMEPWTGLFAFPKQFICCYNSVQPTGNAIHQMLESGCVDHEDTVSVPVRNVFGKQDIVES